MKRLLITILGCVQGVGFRPFVYRLARHHNLKGSISNTTSGVIIDVQGEENALNLFQNDLVATKPKGAMISEIKVEPACLHDAYRFEIKASQNETDTALALLPDTAMCPLCLQELFDPNNRRFQYPFIHCIGCGPRFSLFLSMPFDRANTTMVDFQMCHDCIQEYNNPDDRRFYSQTNCCQKCGPELRLRNGNNDLLANKEEAITQAVCLLQQGKTVAVKNTGGYLLLVDASNEAAVKRLRALKHRPGKPFALLMPNLTEIHKATYACKVADELLLSPSAPIVLIKKREDYHIIAPSVTYDSPYYGMMLPHNAWQHLLLKALNRPLVATSGNISGSPLCISEEEAFSQLSLIADAFLVHNRRISHRLDDSVVHVIADRPVVIRRARGYIPYAISIPASLNRSFSTSLFAVGGQQKSTFAFTKKNHIYISQHLGDLETAETCKAYDQEVSKWEALLNMQPIILETAVQGDKVIHDLECVNLSPSTAVSGIIGIADKHPAYYTNHYLQRRGIKMDQVQHHKAHVWACMIDNQLQPPFLSIVWDGTGWGDDELVWGGETFVVTKIGMYRLATLFPFRLPGIEKAVREPRRTCLGTLYAAFGENIPLDCEQWLNSTFNQEELHILLQALNKKVNSPLCSSVGRLFDAVSALLGFCQVSQFEGQAALALEAAAQKAKIATPRYRIEFRKEDINKPSLMDWRPMMKQIITDMKNEVNKSEIAWAFHEALAQAIKELAQIAMLKNVLLTGGVMQNKLLVEIALDKLQKADYVPHIHRNIPPNDGGLSVGQIVGKLCA